MWQKLVKGYMELRPNHREIVYAVCPDGAILSTGERDYTHQFDPAGQKWAAIPALPDGAEFIGNYAPPVTQ